MLIPINITEYCMIKLIKLYSNNMLSVMIAVRKWIIAIPDGGPAFRL